LLTYIDIQPAADVLPIKALKRPVNGLFVLVGCLKLNKNPLTSFVAEGFVYKRLNS